MTSRRSTSVTRWFAYISPSEPCLLEDVLITPQHSLCKQVNEHYLPKLLPHDHDQDAEQDSKARNMLYNIDGLGVAWYTTARSSFEQASPSSGSFAPCIGVRPAVYRTIQPPLGDLNFRSICANIETRVCFGHVRAASGTAIATPNNHPFAFGRHIFMHNGAVSHFTDIRRDLCNEMSAAAYANIIGSTDSEHMAALYMTYLTHGADASAFEQEYSTQEMAAAMAKTVAFIIMRQQQRFGAKKGPNSLNLCATDGSRLVAYRFRNHSTSQPPSLYYSTTAGTTLNRKYPDHPDGDAAAPSSAAGLKLPEEQHGKHIIIASEPSTYLESAWELIGKNQAVLVEADGTFALQKTPYEFGWDAEG